MSVTSEKSLLISPIKYNRAGDDEGQIVCAGKVGGDLSRKIDEAVCIARKNEEWEAVIKSNHTYGEILAFIKGGEAE